MGSFNNLTGDGDTSFGRTDPQLLHGHPYSEPNIEDIINNLNSNCRVIDY